MITHTKLHMPSNMGMVTVPSVKVSQEISNSRFLHRVKLKRDLDVLDYPEKQVVFCLGCKYCMKQMCVQSTVSPRKGLAKGSST